MAIHVAKIRIDILPHLSLFIEQINYQSQVRIKEEKSIILESKISEYINCQEIETLIFFP